MKIHTWKQYAFWIVITEAVGGLSGWLTRNGTELYKATIEKPPLSPPGIVFPIVWTVLYMLIGIGAARIYMTPDSHIRSKSLWLFLIQLVFNFFWSIIFFNLQRFGFALVWLIVLWILILRMTWNFYKIDRLAAWLQIPYLIWVAFAAYLNLGIWILN
ncbi:MAG: tryptophan-rich sensory protein [Oscillospiraceae bacterium]|nr:tryptophan-rich sensory protein [Oscillospiraceae bacterium]